MELFGSRTSNGESAYIEACWLTRRWLGLFVRSNRICMVSISLIPTESHLNSVDKNEEGDYLISARHASTIYKISRRDGSIIWQLGGKNTSFVHINGFDFSFQHDARFREVNSSTTVISLFNNASNGMKSLKTANTSSVLYIALKTDTSPMTARVIREIHRPDGKQTALRGNAQQLPNGNVFTCWN
jgi:hypothetical protein